MDFSIGHTNDGILSMHVLEGAGTYCTLQYIRNPTAWRADMATVKTTTLTFRIEPCLKEALRTAAHREHRSLANMVEVLIRDYCGRHDIGIPEQGELLPGESND